MAMCKKERVCAFCSSTNTTTRRVESKRVKRRYLLYTIIKSAEKEVHFSLPTVSNKKALEGNCRKMSGDEKKTKCTMHTMPMPPKEPIWDEWMHTMEYTITMTPVIVSGGGWSMVTAHVLRFHSSQHSWSGNLDLNANYILTQNQHYPLVSMHTRRQWNILAARKSKVLSVSLFTGNYFTDILHCNLGEHKNK